MKVLFAVSNEEISESIVKRYQKEYKQIISYKNVYYFNAILKEIQKDKSYDRIVISEELEAFTNTQYDQIDKFIFEKLDGISDEASNSRGSDIPIILICADRRTKGEEMLVKLFGIGIYNAVLGTDRSVEEVCKLINKPRSKKEAKIYYQIDSEDVNYQSENENDVSEIEIQNILAHYRRLGKNEEKYIESFDNIAAQYNDTQLRIISKFLPLNVRAILEERSPKYQQIMSFNNSVSDTLRRSKEEEESKRPSETLLNIKPKEQVMSRPVVIPSSVNISEGKKLSRPKPQRQEPLIQEEPEVKENDSYLQQDDFEEIEKPVEEPPKKRRGRPRKKPLPEEVTVTNENIEEVQPTKRRGRPKKNATVTTNVKQENDEISVLPGLNKLEEENNFTEPEETILPGISEQNDFEENNYYNKNDEVKDEANINTNETFNFSNNINNNSINRYSSNNYSNNNINIDTTSISKNIQTETIDLTDLLLPDKKIATFIGTSKNGTSFIVNNLAELLSEAGVNVAILDTTKNRNSYYIYTKNEESLRETANTSINGLVNGVANGITVNRNLTVYTSLPDENEDIIHTDKILETLLKHHSLILIDTDFDTPFRYFEQSQEIYLVQTLDVLTIQPLTAFLRELKAKNILDEKKIRIVLNKFVKLRGVTEKTIVGGMAYYNDPSMSFMTELFDRNSVRYVTIPFELETYTRYLEGIIECDVSLKGYSKIFLKSLKELGDMLYSKGGTYVPPTASGYGTQSNFSPNMNATLNQMRRNNF